MNSSSPHGHYVTRRFPADSEDGREYQAFVPAPIAEAEISLPSALAYKLEAATAAVYDLRVLAAIDLRVLPPPAARLLHWREALCSSHIEHVVATPRSALLTERKISRPLTAAAADVAGNFRLNTQATELGAALADTEDTVTLADIANLHRTLLRYGHSEHLAGCYRTRQAWIGGATPLHCAYVAPPAQEVGALIADLCAFMARDDLPVLLQAALAHSQFEAIHPFGDGNGRTGRALIHTLLRRRGLTAGLIAPVSGVWVTDTSSYYEGLNAARGESEDGRNDWLSFFAASVEFAAAQAIVLVGEVSRLQARWRELLHTRSDASVLRLVELLPGHPVLSVAEVLGELSVSDVAALGALRTLTEHGILEVSTGRRNRVWFAPELLALLGEHDG